MEFLPSVPPLPSDQVATLDGNKAPQSGDNATGLYDETFVAVLAGRQGPTPLQLTSLSELGDGGILPLAGDVLPADPVVGKVEGAVPVSSLLSWQHIKTTTVGGSEAEISARAGEARHLPTARTSVLLAAYEQTAPPIVLHHQSPSNPQAAMSSTIFAPVALQGPLLADGRSAKQETVEVGTSGTPPRADTVAQSLLANNGMGSLLALSVSPSNSTFTSEQVAHPFGQAGWGQAFGEKVLWLVNNNISQAELRLNPPNLGPLEVRIAVDRDQASVLFTSQHTLVRDTVEATIPRLREMMLASGFSDVDVSVGQHFGSQGQDADKTGDGYPLWATAGDMTSEDAASTPLQSLLGLVDLYV